MRLSEAESQLQLQKWTTIIQEYRSSGMKLKDWLYENNISKDQYYYWQRKLKMEAIKAQDNNSEPAAVIRFEKCSIEINNSASVEIIRNLVKAMAYVK